MTFLSKLISALGGRKPRAEGAGTTVKVESESTSATASADASASAPGATDRSDSTTSGREAGDDRPVRTIDGIGPAYGERLAAAGIETAGDLVAADLTTLASETGIGVGRLAAWVERAEEP